MSDFGLSDDRAKVIEDLAPGSDERFYYRCLLHQHRGELEDVEAIFKEWKNPGSGYHELFRRQSLLRWEEDFERSQSYVRRELGLRFDHQREVEDEADRYPSVLSEEEWSWSSLSRSIVNHGYLSELSPFGADRAAREAARGEGAEGLLEGDRLRSLLQTLPHGDFEEVTSWIARDLDHEDSRGFGSIPIHALLTLAQFEHLAELRPALLQDRRFVDGLVRRLRPDEGLEDPAVRAAYLERLATLVARLGDAFLPLRLEVLYHKLLLPRVGPVDLDLLREYLSVPRHASYVNRDWIDDREVRRRMITFGSVHGTGLAPVRDDEALISELLEELLSDVSGLEDPRVLALAGTLDAKFLRRRLATAKLLSGAVDPDRWAALLDDSGALAQLRERIELRILPENPTQFGREDAVSLLLDVKRVEELTVKVFRLEVENVFHSSGAEPGLGIDLDGLVPQYELRFTYDEPALRRVRRRFDLPQLAGPGLYVVDFIGAGVNSRALVRKGELRLVTRPTAAGQAAWVVDELGRVAVGATLYLAERSYTGDDEGRILIPYSTNPGRRATVLRAGDLVSIWQFDHLAEEFQLSAQLHLDREQLLAGAQATVLVRALLTVNGAPASAGLLSEVRLEVGTRDLRDVSTESEAPLELSESQEATFSFRVPDDCAQVSLRLRARLERPGQPDLELSSDRSYTFNQIDRSDSIRALYLERSDAGYRIEVRGKNGELCPHVVVRVRGRHRGINDPASRTLQASAAGVIELGQLSEILSLSADLEDAPTAEWRLDGQGRALPLPATLNAVAGEPLELPWPGERVPTRADLALFQVRSDDGQPTDERRQDRFDALSCEEGLLRVSGLEPGWYRLYLKGEARVHSLFVSEGERVDRFCVGPRDAAELRYRRPPGLVVAERADALEVAVRNASERTRVHVFATALLPEHDALVELGHHALRPPLRLRFGARASAYESGRVLGEEVRYVLDRQSAEAIPGNLLERPALILNPWALRTTSTRVRDAKGGDGFMAASSMVAGGPMPACAPPRIGSGRGGGRGGAEGGFPTWDFLPEAGIQLLNLRLDGEGRLTVPLSDLGPARCVRVLVCDAELSVEQQLTLGRADLDPKDRRLWLGLDPNEPFAEQRVVRTLRAGEELIVDDLTTAKLARYDTLETVYRLQAILNPSEALTTFAFLPRWATLSVEEQERLYSEHACHELHLFTYFRDRPFFDRVVAPYLRHKRVRTFMDRWLLHEDLSEFTTPWAYGRLNAAERVLLGRRLPEERGPVARHLGELAAGEELDHGTRARLFDAAIQSQDHGEDDLGIEEARAQSKTERTRAAKQGARRRSMSKKKMAKEDSFGAEKVMMDLDDECFEESEAEPPVELSGDDDEWGGVAVDAVLRLEAPQFFRAADRTQELAENDYYKVRADQLDSTRVPAGPFWVELANHTGDEPFLSEHIATANATFTEQALALAVLGLPFSAPAPEVGFKDGGMRLVSASPQIVFLQELRPAPRLEDSIQILVGQRIVRADEEEDDEDEDDDEAGSRSRSDELLVRTVYTCQVVLSNPGDRDRKLDLLIQIPRGALPVEGGRRTESRAILLGGFETESLSYSFYFPEPGEFEHFPVQVAFREAVVASAPPKLLNVVAEPSEVDTTSWSYVSQRGSLDEVVAYLERANLERLDLSRIAWRVGEEAAFGRVMDLLISRHVFDRVLYAYGVHHHHNASTREFLLHEDDFLRGTGAAFTAPIVEVDPVARGWYMHKEYAPLLNARAHRLGDDRELLNDGLREQWAAFLRLMEFRATLTPDDRLALVYYLLVQDRIGEALEEFQRVPRDATRCQLQHDYLGAYLAVSRGEPAGARALAEPYQEHPVRRWRDRFRSVLAMVDELATGRVAESGSQDRVARQTELASQEPSFSLQVEGAKLRLRSQNLGAVVLRYYRMDLELLFSLQPFGWTDSGRFAYTAPHLETDLTLGVSEDRVLALPKDLDGQNVVVEVRGAGQREVVTVYAHSLAVRVMERFGQLQVTHSQGGPLAAVYVKVYARQTSGAVQFFKDGYTDLRGRFDHATLSTDQLDHVERFSILIASREHGALVREAAPPAR
ncbi:MAG: hypothetical protein JKY65_03215 [Planctomycetes bacterium]|nr:hypothetical protein [Planctomycetota bacterium]